MVEEIKHYLLPHLPIHVKLIRQRRAINNQPEPRLFDGRAKHARQFRGGGSEIDRFIDGLDAPGFDPRKVQQCVDQFEQTEAITVRYLEVLAPARIFSQFLFERTKHER